MTNAQLALKSYYEAVIELQKTSVISRRAADVLSSEMMSWVGDYDEFDGKTYTGE